MIELTGSDLQLFARGDSPCPVCAGAHVQTFPLPRRCRDCGSSLAVGSFTPFGGPTIKGTLMSAEERSEILRVFDRIIDLLNDE